ncbi:hypothetical protein IZY60_07240 [Lutibacter sp. B2]|nr:hypothetical protein [Lutibacter sp. B2]
MRKILILSIVCFFMIGSICNGQQANNENLANVHKEDIKNLANEACKLYEEEQYDEALEKIDKIEKYKKDEHEEVRMYALEMAYKLDYYRAMIFAQKKEYEKAIYYLKINGMLEDKNLYEIAKIYKITGQMDEYIYYLKKMLEKEEKIASCAKEEIQELPYAIREKYGLLGKEFEMEDKSRLNKFSYKSFAFMHIGVVILIGVLFYNIKKR